MSHITYECHVWIPHMNHVTDESHIWVMSHKYITYGSPPVQVNSASRCHVTHMNAKRELSERDVFICVTWRIHMCDMTYSYVWHDVFICVTWREDTKRELSEGDMSCVSSLQHTTRCITLIRNESWMNESLYVWAHCNTLKQTKARCNTHHAASHLYGTRVEVMSQVTREHTATHCNTQHTASNLYGTRVKRRRPTTSKGMSSRRETSVLS